MRPKYHLSAPKGLINDPNGFIYYQGEFYLFFQWNPDTLEHQNKHWGLQKTQDFIHFTPTEIALAPDQSYDRDGCYSGSARIENDKLYLVYTGNVRTEKRRNSYQCLAEKTDRGFVKRGPILEKIPKAYTDHFRDPFYFRRNGQDYFVIGAQSENQKGKALLYDWHDLKNPRLLGEIKTNFREEAYMWECPNILQFPQKDVFIFSPQGIPRERYRYQNIYHSLYSIGELNLDNLSFHSEHREELDYGFDFYAPQVLQSHQLLIAWMGVPEHEEKHLSQKENWLHCLTMVRVLSIENNRLLQRPHPNYRILRNQSQSIEKGEFIATKLGEIVLSLDLKEGASFELLLFKSENYETSLRFKEGVLSLDRDRSQALSGVRRLKLGDISKLDLNIFMDQSTLEIFINDGRYVMSSRVYNEEKEVGFVLKESDGIEIKAYQYYSFEVKK